MAVRLQERRAIQAGFAPHDLAGRQLEAAQFGFVVMPAATAVKIAVGVNRRHPVALSAFVLGGLIGVGPDFLDAVVLYFQKDAAGAIGFGDEDTVADDDGAAGVGALQCPRSPAKVKTGLAGRRVEAQEAAPREQEAP